MLFGLFLSNQNEPVSKYRCSPTRLMLLISLTQAIFSQLYLGDLYFLSLAKYLDFRLPELL